jgi:hypothetical protein
LFWVLGLFFGSGLVFAGLRKLTAHQGAGVTLAAQAAALALIVGVVVLVVRRRR